MKTKMFIVLDTNVFIQSIYSNVGPSRDILNFIKSGNMIPVFDKRMLKEYYAVPYYDKFKGSFADEMIRDALYSVVSSGLYINDVEKTAQILKDVKDIPFFEVKESSDELPSTLITGNGKHFPCESISPSQAIERIKYYEVFTQGAKDYDKRIEEVMDICLSASKYTSGKEILNEIFQDIETKEINTSYFAQISGGISGAIITPISKKALNHAELYYEEIRHRTDDVLKIAKNTGYTPEQVLQVKNYLFVESHFIGGKMERFAESFPIAETWQRLADMPEYIQTHDKLLIPHELYEIELVNKGVSQRQAHNTACEKYNYAIEAKKFYENLVKEGKIHKSVELGEDIKELMSQKSFFDFDIRY